MTPRAVAWLVTALVLVAIAVAAGLGVSSAFNASNPQDGKFVGYRTEGGLYAPGN